MICPKCGTDDPGVYLGLEKLECVNEKCSAYCKPEPPKFWKPDAFGRIRFLHGDTDYKLHDFGYRGAQHYMRPVSPSIPKEMLDKLKQHIKDMDLANIDYKPFKILEDD